MCIAVSTIGQRHTAGCAAAKANWRRAELGRSLLLGPKLAINANHNVWGDHRRGIPFPPSSHLGGAEPFSSVNDQPLLDPMVGPPSVRRCDSAAAGRMDLGDTSGHTPARSRKGTLCVVYALPVWASTEPRNLPHAPTWVRLLISAIAADLAPVLRPQHEEARRCKQRQDGQHQEGVVEVARRQRAAIRIQQSEEHGAHRHA